jgi:hypothetical protein
MTIVPHYAARIDFKKDYFEVMGEVVPNTCCSPRHRIEGCRI